MITSSGANIEVSSVNFDFPLYHTSGRSLKKMLFKSVAGRIGSAGMESNAQHRVVVRALRDVSFTLRSGDRLGLIGSNGAGKTTLLRTLAGIYEPASGHVRLRGSLNALLDPNPGMNLDLTGRENIMLRGLINGMNKAQIERLQDDVATFAELGDFINLPVRIYSSGMVVRLGFAMATATRPQVLLMDEWFLAGDADFLEKARSRMEDMVRGAEILVLSTHVPDIVLKWCTRVIWMDQGRIRQDGTPEDVLREYLGPEAFEEATKASALRR